MHELAHIIRGHKPDNVQWLGDYALRQYNDLLEQEANWFAGALLLTKDAVFKIYEYEDKDEMLKEYGVSRSLYNWRVNATAVRVIKERARRRYNH